MKITLKELRNLVRTEVRKKYLRENLNPARTVTTLKELRSLVRESVRSVLKENQSINSELQPLETMIDENNPDTYPGFPRSLEKLAEIIIKHIKSNFNDPEGFLTIIRNYDPKDPKQNKIINYIHKELRNLNNQLPYFPYINYDHYHARKENPEEDIYPISEDIEKLIKYIKKSLNQNDTSNEVKKENPEKIFIKIKNFINDNELFYIIKGFTDADNKNYQSIIQKIEEIKNSTTIEEIIEFLELAKSKYDKANKVNFKPRAEEDDEEPENNKIRRNLAHEGYSFLEDAYNVARNMYAEK